MNESILIADCPSQEMLRELLSGKLAGDDFAAIDTHIKSCTACQAALHRLSDGAQTNEWQQAAEAGDTTSGSTRPLLNRVKHLPPNAPDVVLPAGRRVG